MPVLPARDGFTRDASDELPITTLLQKVNWGIFCPSIKRSIKISKTLTIKSVKCIKPSSVIDSIARGIFGEIGGAIAGTATAVAGAKTGGLLIAATGVAAAGGASAGVAAINGLDHFFAGADELYIKVNGSKIWRSVKYKDIDSQQTKDVDYSTSLTETVHIQLWEYDTTSSDDLLGYLNVDPAHQPGDFTYLVYNENEGSIYEINLRIA